MQAENKYAMTGHKPFSSTSDNQTIRERKKRSMDLDDYSCHGCWDEWNILNESNSSNLTNESGLNLCINIELNKRESSYVNSYYATSESLERNGDEVLSLNQAPNSSLAGSMLTEECANFSINIARKEGSSNELLKTFAIKVPFQETFRLVNNESLNFTGFSETISETHSYGTRISNDQTLLQPEFIGVLNQDFENLRSSEYLFTQLEPQHDVLTNTRMNRSTPRGKRKQKTKSFALLENYNKIETLSDSNLIDRKGVKQDSIRVSPATSYGTHTNSFLLTDDTEQDSFRINSSASESSIEEKHSSLLQHFKDKHYLEKKFTNETKRTFNSCSRDSDALLPLDLDEDLVFQFLGLESIRSSRTNTCTDGYASSTTSNAHRNYEEIAEDCFGKSQEPNNAGTGVGLILNSTELYCNVADAQDEHNNLKILKQLYPVRSRASRSSKRPSSDSESKRSILSYEEFLNDTGVIEEDAAAVEEEKESREGSESVDDFGKRDCDLTNATLVSSWSFIGKKSYRTDDSKGDNGDDMSDMVNSSELKEGVVNVLERFLKDNLIISNLKSNEYDVFIIPKDVSTRNSYSCSEMRSRSLCSVTAKPFSSQCVSLDMITRRLLNRKHKKKSERKGAQKIQNVLERRTFKTPEVFPKVVSNSLPTFNLMTATKGKATSHESYRKFKCQKTSSMTTDETSFCEKSLPLHRYKKRKSRKKTEKLDESHKQIKHRERRRMKRGILSELNEFKEVLGEMERKQSALIRKLNYDPCGFSYSFSANSNIKASNSLVHD